MKSEDPPPDRDQVELAPLARRGLTGWLSAITWSYANWKAVCQGPTTCEDLERARLLKDPETKSDPET